MGDGEQSEKRKHFRGKARAGRRIELVYHRPGETPIPAVTRDIGVGGAFIVTDTPEDIGVMLQLELRLPHTSPSLRVDCEVRWTSTTEEAPGMGVKFQNLDVEALLILSDYFASLTGTDTAE